MSEIKFELVGTDGRIFGAQLRDTHNADAFIRVGKRDFVNLGGMR